METDSQTSSQTNECVEEEYVIQVPLVRPKQKFQEVLRLAGATGETFTKKEICHYLKDYISSRQLFDVADPRIVHCGDDLLGQVFGVEKFTIDEALDLLAKNCDELPDKCVRRKRRLVIQPYSGQSSNPRPATVTIAVCHDTSQCTGKAITTSSTLQRDVKPKRKSSSSGSSGNGSAGKQTAGCQCDVTSSTQTKSSLDEQLFEQSKKNKRKKHSKGGSIPGSSPRKRRHTEPSSSTQCPGSSRQRGTSLSITYGTDGEEDGFPWYFQVEVSDNCKDEDDESEVLSVQGKETVTVRDSTDDLWFVEDDDEVSDVEFSVEYDVESDSPDLTESDLSSVRSGEGLIVVCRESDVEFFADNSDSESNTDDRELTEADNWLCLECKLSNPPFQRYCDRCWKLRSDWLPNSQSSLELNAKANQNSVPVKIYDMDSGFGSQETVLSQSTTPTVKTLDLPVLTDFGKPKKPLIESASDQRYSFSSIQLKENSNNTAEAAKKETIQQTVKTNSPLDDPCMICLTKAKNASLIHGSSGHQVCCFSCAKRLKRRGKVCPVCRRPIQKVVKNYIL